MKPLQFISTTSSFCRTLRSMQLAATVGVRRAVRFQNLKPIGIISLHSQQMVDMMNYDNDPPDVKTKKHTMRKVLRARLSAMPAADIVSESKRVCDLVFEIPEYKNALSVGLFLSMPSGEVRTDDILIDAVANGKRVFVPNICKYGSSSEMDMLEVPREEIASGSILSWPRNNWGIPEPPKDMVASFAVARPGDIDLFIVPGLAFDRKGNRLGQGKGYYDRYLRRICSPSEASDAADERAKARRPFLAAVGLHCQLVEEVPVEESDQRMDLIATPGELVLVRVS